MSRKNGRGPDIIKIDPTDLDVRAAGDTYSETRLRDLGPSPWDEANSGLTYFLDPVLSRDSPKLNPDEKSINDHSFYDS